MAWRSGTYTYFHRKWRLAHHKKVGLWDSLRNPAELIKQQIEAAKARALADKKRAEQGQIAAVKWLQPKATNGDNSAQYELGLHYLKGQGCESNRESAIYWLQKSASQGNLQASNRLASLTTQP